MPTALQDIEIAKCCLRGEPKAQRELYDRYKGRLMGICRRYAREKAEANDIFQESFIKIFQHLHTVQQLETLDSWVRQIVIRTAINHAYANKKFYRHENTEQYEQTAEDCTDVIAQLDTQTLLALMETMPEGYRTIFNLYVIDGFTHPQIAEMLRISDGTSKSQLARAKALMRHELSKIGIVKYEQF